MHKILREERRGKRKERKREREGEDKWRGREREKGRRYRRADKFKTLGTFVCARYERVKETSGVSYERSEYSFFSITISTTDAIASFTLLKPSSEFPCVCVATIEDRRISRRHEGSI